MAITRSNGTSTQLPPATTLEIKPLPNANLPTHAYTQQLQRVLETPLEFVSSASFDTATMDDELRQTLSNLVTRDSLDENLPQNLPGHLARLCECSRLTPQDEQQLFRSMNFLKFRAQERRLRPHKERLCRELLTSIEEDLQNAERVRNHIIRANTRLVFSVIRKFVNPQHSFDDLLSDGIFTKGFDTSFAEKFHALDVS